MAQLTKTGEVAEFIDDDQFGTGQSVDKCGPEAVSEVWHATEPGQPNHYTSADVHAMAHADYTKYIGPDVPSDHGGTSNQTLYNMLEEHGFHYQGGPARMSWVKAELNAGKIVIIGIVESSVHDNGVGGCPYAWNTNGLTHVIVASGPAGDNDIAVRDTANIGPQGVRPGPRYYDANKLQLISATSVTPTWLGAPPPTPATPVAIDLALALWNSTGTAAPYNTGIATDWKEHYNMYGPPLGKEFNTEDGGEPVKAQSFAGGWCAWNRATSKATWHKWQ